MSESDLLQGDDLNHITVPDHGRQVPPMARVYREWYAGPYHQGVWLVNRQSNSLKTAGDGGGIDSAARLSAGAQTGSVYHSLGTLEANTAYILTWSATADHDDNPEKKSDYTVRIAVNYKGTLDASKGGIERDYTAAFDWDIMTLHFTPTQTGTFYLSFKGGANKHPGALISKVSVKKYVAVPEHITTVLESPLTLRMGKDPEATDQLSSVENWVFRLTDDAGKPVTAVATVTVNVTDGLAFASDEKTTYTAPVTDSKVTLVKGRVIAPANFTAGKLTLTAAGSTATFTVTANVNVKEEWKLYPVPDTLSLSKGQSRSVSLTMTKNGKAVSTAMLNVKVDPTSLASVPSKTLQITDGKGILTLTAGQTPGAGHVIVSNDHVSIHLPVTVQASSRTIVQFGTPSSQIKINAQNTLRIQVLDEHGTPLDKISIVMTVKSDSAALQLEAEFAGQVPVLFTAAMPGQHRTAVTRHHPDGVYATFHVMPGTEGESVLNFTAPNASPVELPLLSVQTIVRSQLIVFPQTLHLRPGMPVSGASLITITVDPPESAARVSAVHFKIEGPTDDGLYIVKKDSKQYVVDQLPMVQGVAKVTGLQAGKNTTEPQSPYTITFWSDKSNVSPGVTKVFIENGDHLIFHPPGTQSAPIPVDVRSRQLLKDCTLRITDVNGLGVGNASYRFVIHNTNTQVKFSDTQGPVSQSLASKASGFITLPEITVGENIGSFSIQAYSDTNHAQVFDGWSFVAQEPQPILVIRFAREKEDSTLSPANPYKDIDKIEAYTDTLFTTAARSGQINFAIDDPEKTQTYFGDGTAATIQVTVDIVNGVAEIPALTTGNTGTFTIVASVVGNSSIFKKKKITIK